MDAAFKPPSPVDGGLGGDWELWLEGGLRSLYRGGDIAVVDIAVNDIAVLYIAAYIISR